MPQTASLSTKLARIGVALLAVALVSIGLTLWITWQLEGGAAAVNEAGRLRMQVWRLATLAHSPAAAPQLREAVREFDGSLRLLRAGDATRPLFVPQDARIDADFAAVEAAWGARRAALERVAAAEPAVDLGAAEFVAAIDRLVSGIESHLARLTALLNLFQMAMVALAIGSAVVVVYTGYLYVISPLAHVREGLRQVEAGDFTARVHVGTVDEFGQVAAGFNRMASTLQALYAGLEAQVDAKTRRVETQRARLAALYEVSAFLAEAGTLEQMAEGFAARLRALAKADAAVVRWTADGQRWLLLAADRFPAQLCRAEHSLAAGTCACGNVQAESPTRVIPIHADAPERVRPCSHAGYGAVVSVPIRHHHRLLGEFDLFYVDAVTLSEEESGLLEALTSHLASAMEGLRAAALEREAAASGERALLARELHDSIAQSLAFLRIQAQLLRTALERGNAQQVRATLDELDAGLEESTGDVRELLLHFRTRTNEGDIETALQVTLQKFRHQTGLPATLEVRGQGLPLAPDVQIHVLHVLQEALSNVRKHARAKAVAVTVDKGPRWRFTVHDDGAGFAPSAGADDTRVGQKIMRERAARIGAELSVVSTPGQGCTVTLSVPDHARVAAAPHTPPALLEPA